jgi:multiple sugar transport system substrate-binding protein
MTACSRDKNSGSGGTDKGTEGNASNTDKGSASQDKVEINVAVGSFASSSVMTAKEQFEAAHDNVTVNVIEIPFGSLYEKLSTSFATNTAAYDIAIYPSNWLSEFIQGNYIISLDDYLADKDNWDTLIPAYYDMQRFEDKGYAVPLDGDSIILYYRKDALENEEYKASFKEKYGYDLAVPTTWAEYRTVAEFFNGWDWDGDGAPEYGTIEAMAPKDVGGYIFFNRAITYAANPNYPGYTFFDPDTMEPEVANEAYKRALTEYLDILQFGPPNMINYGGGEERAAFAAGESAMAIDWHDTGIMAQDINSSNVKENVGYALSPGTKECWNPETESWDTFEEVQYAPYLAFSGWTSSVTATCKNPDVAADFLDLMDNDENSLKAVTTSGTARNPYRQEHLTDPLVWENSDIKFYNAKEFLDTILASYTNPNVQLDLRIPKAGSYLDALDLGVSMAISGDMKVEEALDYIYDSWKSITAEQGLENQKAFYLNTYSNVKTGIK